MPSGIGSALTNTTISNTYNYGTHGIASGDTLAVLFNKLAFDQGDYISKSANQVINGSLKINSLTGFIEVPTPVTASEAANKGYVDSFGQWIKGTGGNINDLYFNTGKVGIGTTAPSAKLDVAGEVKFGNTSSACNSSNEGQQRYNLDKHLMEFCNGTLWAEYGTITTCPFSMTRIGDAGKRSTYCIDTAARADSNYASAVTTCFTLTNDTSVGNAHLCDFNEWTTACVRSAVSSMDGLHTEIVSSAYGSGSAIITVGQGSCASNGSSSANTSNAFRCCVR
jgi:hypothetical protein